MRIIWKKAVNIAAASGDSPSNTVGLRQPGALPPGPRGKNKFNIRQMFFICFCAYFSLQTLQFVDGDAKVFLPEGV